MKKSFTNLWKILKNSASEFGTDSVPKKSAALSYYTMFSLSPMLVVIMGMANLFFAEEIVQGHLYEFIFNTLGKESAVQIQETLKNQRLDGNSLFATIVGVVTLIIGSTSMFGEMQDSINQIWRVETKPKKKILSLLLSRLTSFSMIIVLGIILSVSLVLNFLLDIFSENIKNIFNLETILGMQIMHGVISLSLLISLFTLLFKLMPDVKLQIRQILPGAIFTAVLFFIGEFLIGLYLSETAAVSSYGTAGSIVAILLWVYFSSIILYTGAIFTRQYILYHYDSIQPSPFAILTETD